MALRPQRGGDAVKNISDDNQRARADEDDVEMLSRKTGLFSNPDLFEAIRAAIISKLFNLIARPSPARDDDSPDACEQEKIRVWIPSCGNGHESYSLAILLAELVNQQSLRNRVQIFATDRDENKLQLARRGVYHEHDLVGLSAERRDRFFTPLDERCWQIKKSIRELITFAQHNLFTDIPFGRQHLLYCRDLPDELDGSAIDQLLLVFHFSLREGGLLVLPSSNPFVDTLTHFESLTPRWQVYSRKASANSHWVQLLQRSDKSVAIRNGSRELRNTVESLRTANADFAVMNEELQSINEELGASKEELQSLNQALGIVNNRLNLKITELDAAKDDLSNMMASTPMAILFLDLDLRIQRFTPSAAKLFNLRDHDIGRPFNHISTCVDDATLFNDCGLTLRDLRPLEVEVRERKASESRHVENQNHEAEVSCYLRRISPYCSADDRPAGVVVTYVDITSRIANEAKSRSIELHKQILQVAENEQRRIGQELHDGTGQELTGLSFFASTLVDLIKDASPVPSQSTTQYSFDELRFGRLQQTAERLLQGLITANKNINRLSHGIMPVQIEADGLRSALEELANATNAQQGICCRYEGPYHLAVPNNSTATHLYRIAQEAINNALKHAKATELSISLFRNAQGIVLKILDNGVGFSIAPQATTNGHAKRKGLGLETMKYRATMIGGMLHIAQRDEGGTSIECIVPD